MPFKTTVYEADDRLFQADRPLPTRTQAAAPAKPSPAEELDAWRKRAEETARKYQELLQSYKQVKASLKGEAEWRQRCQKLMHAALRNCRDLGLAVQAAHKAGEHAHDPIRTALIAGMEQVIENQLRQLHAEGLLELIEPQPSELFDDNLHQAIGTKPSAELAAGLIAEVVDAGYACAGKAVRKARVLLAGTENG